MPVFKLRCCLSVIAAVSLTGLAPVAYAAAAKYDSQCLDGLIRTIILEDDVTEVARRPPPADPVMHAFYLPGATICTFNGGYAPAGGPPKAIALYLADRESHGKVAYCPQPFSPVRIHAPDTATGCRPISAPSANACALRAYVGQGEATMSVARDVDTVTDLEFVQFLRDTMPLDTHDFPQLSKCLRR